MSHNQPIMPRDCAIPSSEISQDPMFSLPPSANPAYREPYRASYPQYHDPLTPSGGVAHVHRATHPGKQPNNIGSAHASGPAHGTTYTYGPSSLVRCPSSSVPPI
ncbi:hypothetical protein BC826DRAFT_1030121 [Russula brevipes]|nr:hypothetical protein BC826DRAFT_1030121 [Russula brevipes]